MFYAIVWTALPFVKSFQFLEKIMNYNFLATNLMPAVVTAVGIFAILNLLLAAKYATRVFKTAEINRTAYIIGISIIWLAFFSSTSIVLYLEYVVIVSSPLHVKLGVFIGTIIATIFGIRFMNKKISEQEQIESSAS